MVSLSSFLDRRNDLLAVKEEVISSTKTLFLENDPGTFTGRGNTKSDIQERINKYSNMLDSLL